MAIGSSLGEIVSPEICVCVRCYCYQKKEKGCKGCVMALAKCENCIESYK